jgi:hypothetical protein
VPDHHCWAAVSLIHHRADIAEHEVTRIGARPAAAASAMAWQVHCNTTKVRFEFVDDATPNSGFIQESMHKEKDRAFASIVVRQDRSVRHATNGSGRRGWRATRISPWRQLCTMKTWSACSAR